MTYPNEAWPADSEIEALDGTTHPLTGLPYIGKGTGPASTPSYEVQYNRREQRVNAMLAGWRQGMAVDEGDLKVGVYPLQYTLGGLRRSFGGASGVAVPDNSERVLYLDSGGALQLTAAWPSDLTSFMPLAAITAAAGRLTITDQRVQAAFHVPSVEVTGVKDRRILTAYRASVGPNENGIEIFEFDPREDLTLEEVQIYCSAAAATASVDVKAGGSSLLSAPGTPAAGAVVKPAVAVSSISSASNLTVHVTTNASGTISNLAVTLLFKAGLAS